MQSSRRFRKLPFLGLLTILACIARSGRAGEVLLLLDDVAADGLLTARVDLTGPLPSTSRTRRHE